MIECGNCGIKNVRLYRPYGNFYRSEDNRCNRCLTRKDRDWYVPLILDNDGSVWGYTSVPEEAIVEFNKLPEADSNYPTWVENRFVG